MESLATERKWYEKVVSKALEAKIMRADAVYFLPQGCCPSLLYGRQKEQDRHTVRDSTDFQKPRTQKFLTGWRKSEKLKRARINPGETEGAGMERRANIMFFKKNRSRGSGGKKHEFTISKEVDSSPLSDFPLSGGLSGSNYFIVVFAFLSFTRYSMARVKCAESPFWCASSRPDHSDDRCEIEDISARLSNRY